MPDQGSQHDVSHAVFGLTEERGAPSAPKEESGGRAPSPAPPGSSGGPVLILMLVALLVLSGVDLYLAVTTREQASKQSDELKVLTRRMDGSDDRYAQLKAQFEVTSEKLGMTQAELGRARELAVAIQKQQRAAVAQLNQAIEQKASAQQLNQLQSESSAKFGALSGGLAGTQKDLAATREALSGAKGELSGAIARTHDELVALAHRTDRDYFEFNLTRRKARSKVGGVMVELEKTNVKRNQYTVDLFFDDKRTERKDEALDAPVFFYVLGASSPLELVVNKLGKNTASGYLSTPKGLYPNTPSVLAARPGS